MTEQNVEDMIRLVEVNIGNFKTEVIAIIDINYKVWGKKGSEPESFLDYYKKFPLLEMHTGDSIHNNNSFLMKVTEKTGLIIVMSDPQIARLASMNLKNRINALSDFYTLEKFVIPEDAKSKKGKILKNEERMW